MNTELSTALVATCLGALLAALQCLALWILAEIWKEIKGLKAWATAHGFKAPEWN